jgi:hypothetical protein
MRFGNVSLSEPDRPVTAMVLRSVDLTLIDGSHHPQIEILRLQIKSLEGQLLRSDRSHRHQIDKRTDRLLEGVDQL